MVKQARRRTIAIVALIGVAAISFPITILSASLPIIADDLGTTDTAAAWVISAPLLAVAVFTPAAGKLGDLYGHRKMFLAGFGVSGLLHLITALAPNIAVLILVRTLSAAAAAPAGPAALAILMRTFPGERRNEAMGWWGAVVAASPAVGVVAGGPAVDLVGWPIVFIGQGVAALAATGLAWRVLPTTKDRRSVKFDIPGAITLGAAIGTAMVAINRGPSWGWTSPAVLGLGAVSPVLLWLFIRVERTAAQPLLPPQITEKPAVIGLFTSQTVNQAAYMGGFVISPFLLSRVFGFTATITSLVLVGRPLAFSASAGLAGRIASRYPQAKAAGASILVMAGALLATGVGTQIENLPLIIGAMIVTGLGMGFGRPIVMTAMSHSVHADDHGVASGTFQMMVMLGSAIGISTLTTFVGESESPARFLAAYAVAAVVSVGAAWGTNAALSAISTEPREAEPQRTD